MRIEEELKLDYSDVLFRPKRSTLKSRKDVNLLRTYRFKYSKNEWSGIPIMAANMDGVGELSVAEKLNEYGMITCLTKQHDVKKIKQNKNIKKIYPNIALSVGIKKEDFQNLDKVLKEFSFFKFICIDVANGYTEHFTNFIKSVRDKYPTKTIIAGNVVTGEMTEELIIRGADVVKVGIGQGSPCTTKDKTGFTLPMFTCVQACAENNTVPIIADGGIKCNGDIAKALVAGASWVMAGGMFASCMDSPADGIQTEHGIQKIYYGSASAENKGHKRNIEGVKRSLNSNGMTYQDKLEEIKQDLQSSISYAGGDSLDVLTPENVLYSII